MISQIPDELKFINFEFYFKYLKIPGLKYTDEGNFLLIAGPCVVENRELVETTAEKLCEISQKLSIPFVFKSSYRKANRSKADSFTGIGDIRALEILRGVREKYSVPVITDIHNPDEAAMAAEYVDILQIPAFLCRQTDLLVAAAKTGKWVNIKKGQFVSGRSMKFAAGKVREAGNDKIMLTERGNMFGYQDLVVDFRNIPEMKKIGVPVIMDITHSLQQPNQDSGVSGGNPEMIETIGKAAIAAGADGIFIETHPDPSRALSDGANMLRLSDMEALMVKLTAIYRTVKSFK
ncbi:MAG: 3-deoxy-8-phosphooctulonate synthase [Bacteroidales bacterium]|nr:3-deoxy-8-phosphooctulonate synthase [Bacteroidales bacterium]